MRIKQLLLVIGLCSLAAGCCPLVQVARSTIIEPVHYCNSLELVLECARNRALADAAWEEVERTNSDGAYSGDYAAGFHEGFTDYLFAGGSGALMKRLISLAEITTAASGHCRRSAHTMPTTSPRAPTAGPPESPSSIGS